jgi:K(+)-stimulated pyrophosphate-energized sodium pump
VIADCTGDNAGDSVGPTADGFETYGVTGVALIAFLAAALGASPMSVREAHHLALRHARPDDRHLARFLLPQRGISKAMFGSKKDFDFEAPLTMAGLDHLGVSIAVTFVASSPAAHPRLQWATHARLWWVLSVIISCGTVAGALIPEFTKIFTSTNSRHVREVTNCSKHGGASLNILSGFVPATSRLSGWAWIMFLMFIGVAILAPCTSA